MKRVLIAKDLAYANNKASAGVNKALNPTDLLAGGVGVYGVPKTSTNNKDKLALIIDGGSDAAGLVPDTAYDGKFIIVALGLASGAREAIKMEIGDLQDIDISAQTYSAAVAGIWAVGYYNTAGQSNNLPTAVTDDVVGIKVKQVSEPYDALGLQWEKRLVAGESDYSALTRLANAITDDQSNSLVTVKLIGNLAGTVFTTAATVAAVQGATSLTTSAAHGVNVLDYVQLNGDVYQAITGTATTTLVLDSPYRGATATITNATALDLGATVPTELGLVFTGKTVGEDLVVSAYGNLEDATRTDVTAASVGQGTADLMLAMEEAERGRLGTATRSSAEVPQPGLNTASDGTYDVYTFSYKNQSYPKGDNARIMDVRSELIIAFPAGGSAGAQAEFEDIMGTLILGSDGIGGLD